MDGQRAVAGGVNAAVVQLEGSSVAGSGRLGSCGGCSSMVAHGGRVAFRQGTMGDCVSLQWCRRQFSELMCAYSVRAPVTSARDKRDTWRSHATKRVDISRSQCGAVPPIKRSSKMQLCTLELAGFAVQRQPCARLPKQQGLPAMLGCSRQWVLTVALQPACSSCTHSSEPSLYTDTPGVACMQLA